MDRICIAETCKVESDCFVSHMLLSLRSRRFYRKLVFGTQKWQRTLVKDEIGIVPVPRFHRNTFEQEELSDRSRRQVSLYLCCIDHNDVRCLVFLLSFLQPRHILAALRFNQNLVRDVKKRLMDQARSNFILSSRMEWHQ